MKRSKRLAADCSTIAVRAMLDAASPLPKCPRHVTMRKADRPFWTALLRARSRDEWTEADLVLAAQLARCQADIESESTLLASESSVLTNKRGTQVVNPRVGVLDQLARRELALMRALRVGGPIPVRDLTARRGIDRAAERARAEIVDDGLDSLLA